MENGDVHTTRTLGERMGDELSWRGDWGLLGKQEDDEEVTRTIIYLYIYR